MMEEYEEPLEFTVNIKVADKEEFIRMLKYQDSLNAIHEITEMLRQMKKYGYHPGFNRELTAEETAFACHINDRIIEILQNNEVHWMR